MIYNNGDEYRLGDVFLKNHYAIYDLDAYKVGLGRSIGHKSK